MVVADEPIEDNSFEGDYTIIPDDAKVIKKTVKIGAIVDYESYYRVNGLTVLTTLSQMNTVLPFLKYRQLNFSLGSDCTSEIDDSVSETINGIIANIDQSQCTSNYEFKQSQKQETKNTIVAVLAIIILIFTISLSIINNTITSSIRNSKQKIGTLRAVGADEKELVKSYIYQLLSMFMWGTGLGLGGFAISYLIIYLVQKSKDVSLEMIFNPLLSLAFIIVVFSICTLNLWFNIRKEMKNSIVENIREL